MAKAIKFNNELTYDSISKRKESEFHEKYEAAHAKVMKSIGKDYPIAIGGKERFSKEGVFADFCPYDTSIVVGKFQKGTREDVMDAVDISITSQESWERTKVHKRCAIFKGAASLIARDKYELAAWLTLENGKNRFEAMAEVDEAIDYMRYYATVLDRSEGYALEMNGPMKCNEVKSILRPLGVIGVISPFNFPLAITGGMVTGALITGNAAILKPASDTPLMGYLLYKALITAGVPSEVFHYITGPGETVGEELTSNAGIAALVFTGSRAVGTGIAKKSMEFGKRPPILEMGGKNPVIVSDKADLDIAVEGVGRSAFGYCGQKCSATSRVIVHKKVSDKFLKKLVDWISEKKIGEPWQRGVFVGPLINNAAVERYRKVIWEAAQKGQVLTGGHILDDTGPYSKGYYVEPSVIVHLPKDHEFVWKELFAPILIALTYEDFDQAIDLANDIEYGLTAGLFSEDPTEIERFFDRIQAGVTYVNKSSGATTGALVGRQSFTGWKASGVTGKGAGGPYYLLQFLQEQSRTICR
jgi:1-pyrroline-5-carboxylate dehydrogenase